jgi:hypothetical protein
MGGDDIGLPPSLPTIYVLFCELARFSKLNFARHRQQNMKRVPGDPALGTEPTLSKTDANQVSFTRAPSSHACPWKIW